MDVGQPEWASLELVGEFCVVESEQVQHRRVQVMHVYFVLRDIEAKLIGLAENDTALESAACHPHRECIRMMIASVGPALHHRGTAKLAAPDDDRVLQQPSLLQILDKRCRCFV